MSAYHQLFGHLKSWAFATRLPAELRRPRGLLLPLVDQAQRREEVVLGEHGVVLQEGVSHLKKKQICLATSCPRCNGAKENAFAWRADGRGSIPVVGKKWFAIFESVSLGFKVVGINGTRQQASGLLVRFQNVEGRNENWIFKILGC